MGFRAHCSWSLQSSPLSWSAQVQWQPGTCGDHLLVLKLCGTQCLLIMLCNWFAFHATKIQFFPNAPISLGNSGCQLWERGPVFHRSVDKCIDDLYCVVRKDVSTLTLTNNLFSKLKHGKRWINHSMYILLKILLGINISQNVQFWSTRTSVPEGKWTFGCYVVGAGREQKSGSIFKNLLFQGRYPCL